MDQPDLGRRQNASTLLVCAAACAKLLSVRRMSHSSFPTLRPVRREALRELGLRKQVKYLLVTPSRHQALDFSLFSTFCLPSSCVAHLEDITRLVSSQAALCKHSYALDESSLGPVSSSLHTPRPATDRPTAAVCPSYLAPPHRTAGPRRVTDPGSSRRISHLLESPRPRTTHND